MSTVLKNCNIIPISRDGILENVDIYISDEIITGISKTDKKPYGDVKIIDCTDKFVMPGMIDAHYHLYHGDDITLSLNVACGVTSVRNMWGNQQMSHEIPEIDSYQMKKDIEAKRLLGPTLINTSRICDGEYPVVPTSRPQASLGSMEQFMKEALREGADQIKVYEKLDKEVFDLIVELANEYELKIVGHIPQPVNKKLFMNKAYSLEHTLSVDIKDMDYMARTNVLWVPTLIVENAVIAFADGEYEHIIHKEYDQYLSAVAKELWAMIAERRKGISKNKDNPMTYYVDKARGNMDKVRRYYELGREVATGTDYANPYCYPGFGIHTEMKLIEECGATRQQSLRAATINAARVLELEDRKGTLEVGKDADIVVLNANPLENLDNTLSIETVVLMGTAYDRASLDKILQKCRES
jgi:imidazolonepropionase-like amidohydrolase